jgi:hypothetical protein
MNLGAFQSAVLLAVDEEAYRVWGRFDHGKTTFGTGHLVTIVGITALLVLAVMVWRIIARRSARTFKSDSPTRLFRELCAAHGLKRSDRRLLQQLATSRRVMNAETLFVEPQHFETKNLPPELKPSVAALRQLRVHLFS